MSGGFQYNNPRHHAPTFQARQRVFEDEMSSAPTMDGDEPSVLAPLPPMHHAMHSFHASTYGPSSSLDASNSPSRGSRANSNGGSNTSGNSPSNRTTSSRSHTSQHSRQAASSKAYITPLPPMSSITRGGGSNDGPSFGSAHPGAASTHPTKSLADDDDGEGQEVDIYTQSDPGRKNKILLLIAVGCMIVAGAVIGAMFGLGIINIGGDSKADSGAAQESNSFKQNAAAKVDNRTVSDNDSGDGDSSNDAQVDAPETEDTDSTEGDSTFAADSNQDESDEGASDTDIDTNTDTDGADTGTDPTDATTPNDTSDSATEINDFMNGAVGDGTDEGEGGIDIFDMFGDGVSFYSGPLGTTDAPTITSPPTPSPTSSPSSSDQGSDPPTTNPTATPTTDAPTTTPVSAPTKMPVSAPTDAPTNTPVSAPSSTPTEKPTPSPTVLTSTAPPTSTPTNLPTGGPTPTPITKNPSSQPTRSPEKFQPEATQLIQTAPTPAPTEGEIIRRRLLRAQYIDQQTTN
jgi:hypothetical protein